MTHGQMLLLSSNESDYFKPKHLHAYHDGNLSSTLNMLIGLPREFHQRAVDDLKLSREENLMFYGKEMHWYGLLMKKPAFVSIEQLTDMWRSMIPTRTSTQMLANLMVWMQFGMWQIAAPEECNWYYDEETGEVSQDFIISVNDGRIVSYDILLDAVKNELDEYLSEEIDEIISKYNKGCDYEDAKIVLFDDKIHVPFDFILIERVWNDIQQATGKTK